MKLEYHLLCGIALLVLFARQVESLAVCKDRMLSTNKNNGTITVSSILLDPNVIATPDKAVLNTKEQNLGQGHFEAGGWVAGVQDTKQYLQIQLTSPSVIRGVVTQGRNGCCQQWVSEYRVSYSQDCKTWIDIKKTFTGNTDQDTTIENLFPCPVSAKCIRITPLKWNDKISMRVDVLGCPIIPISTLHLTTKPISLSTTTPHHMLGATNISSTIAMTQTATGLKSSVYTRSTPNTTPASTILTSGPSSSNSCSDTHGIDCKLLQAQVKICNNPIASSKYCQKYCGLCGPTTSMPMSTTTPIASTIPSQLLSSSTIPSTLKTSIITNSHFTSTTDTPQITANDISTLSTFYQPSNTLSTTDQALASSMPTSVNSIFHLSTSFTTRNDQTSSSRCKDNLSIDCNFLNATIGICSNLLTAQLYCPNFCNVCGISTSTQSTEPSTLTFQSDQTTTTTVNLTTMNSCQDRKGVDCSLLQKFYKVCQDKTSAITYCPNYCGLCVSATFPSQTTPVKKTSSYFNSISTTTSVSTNVSGFSNSTSQNTVISSQSRDTDSTTFLPVSTGFSRISKTQKLATLNTSPFISGSTFLASNLTSNLATSTGSITSCTDKNGIDCKMLDTYLHLCADRKAALMYCPLYCGFCGASTVYMSSSGHSNTASNISIYTRPITKQTSISSTGAHTHRYVTKDQSTQPISISTSKFATLGTSTANYPFTTPILSSAQWLMTSTTKACKDARGVDCSVLNKYWKICSNRAAAIVSCPLFCGLCGSSTQAYMLQSSPVITTTPPHSTRRNRTNGTQTLLNTTLPLASTILSNSTAPSTSSDATSAMPAIIKSSSQSTQADTFSTNQMTQFSTVQTCKDKPGIDCRQLDVYLGVCSDFKSAQLYCPLYCGLCGSTTAYQSQHASLPSKSAITQTSWNNLSVAQSTFTILQPKTTLLNTASSLSGSSPMPLTTYPQSNKSTNAVKTTVLTKGYKTQQSTMVPSVYSKKSIQSQTNTKSSFSNIISLSTMFPSSKWKSNVMSSTTAVSDLPSSIGSVGSSVTASCMDKSGVDCKQLDKYLNICSDPVTSNAYCKKYCGLCTQMTITNTHGISSSAGQSTTARTNNFVSTSNQHSSSKSALLSTTLSYNKNANTISVGKTTFNINAVTLFSNTKTSIVSNSTPPALSLVLSTSSSVTNVSSHTAQSSYTPKRTSNTQFNNTLSITTGLQASSKQINFTSPNSSPSSGHITNSTSTGATLSQTSNSYSTGQNLSSSQPLSIFLTSISSGSTFKQTDSSHSPTSHFVTSVQKSPTSLTTSSTSTTDITFLNSLISQSSALLSGQTISAIGSTSTSGQTFSASQSQDITSGQTSSNLPTTGATSTSGQPFSNSLKSQSSPFLSGQTLASDYSTGSTSTSVQTNSNTLKSQAPDLTSSQSFSSALPSQSRDMTSVQTSYISSTIGPSPGQIFSVSLPSHSLDITSGTTNSNLTTTGASSTSNQGISSTLTSPGISSGQTSSTPTDSSISTSGQAFSNTSISHSTSILSGQSISSEPNTWPTSTSGKTNSTSTSQTPSLISGQTISISLTSESQDKTSGQTKFISAKNGSSSSRQTSLSSLSSQSHDITSGQTSSTPIFGLTSTPGQAFTVFQTFPSGQTISTGFSPGPTSTQAQTNLNSLTSQGLVLTSDQTFSSSLPSQCQDVTTEQTSSISSTTGPASTSSQTFSISMPFQSQNITTGQTSLPLSPPDSSSTSSQTLSYTLTSHSPSLISGQTISSDFSTGPTSSSLQTNSNTLTSQTPTSPSDQTIPSFLPSQSRDITTGQTSSISTTTGSTSTSGQTFSNYLPSQTQNITSGLTSSTSSTTGSNLTLVQTNSNTLTYQTPTLTSSQLFSTSSPSQSQDITSGLASPISSTTGTTSNSGQTLSISLSSQDTTSAQTSSTSFTTGSTSNTGKTFSSTMPSQSQNKNIGQTSSISFTTSPTLTPGRTISNSLSSQSQDVTSGQTSSTSPTTVFTSISYLTSKSPGITSGQTSSTSSNIGSTSISSQIFSTTLKSKPTDLTFSKGNTLFGPTSISNQTLPDPLNSTTPGFTSIQSSKSSPTISPSMASSQALFSNTVVSIPSGITAGHQSFGNSSSGTTPVSSQTFSRSSTPTSPMNAIRHTNTLAVTTITNNPGQTPPNSSPFLTRMSSQFSKSSVKPYSTSVSLSSTKQVTGYTTNAQVYSLSGKSGPTSSVQISSASLSQTSNTKHASYYTGTQVSSGASSSTVSPLQNTTIASSTISPQISIASTYMPTTPDPCNDTLDCPLVDKFWGVCQDIATAKGCLSYCGFCPSGIPLTQHITASITSQSPGISTGASFSMSPKVRATPNTFQMTPLNSRLPNSPTTAMAQQSVTNLNITSQINTAITAQSARTFTQSIPPITNDHTGAQGGTSQPNRPSAQSTLSSSGKFSVIHTSTKTITGQTNASKQVTTTKPFISGQPSTSSSGFMASPTTAVNTSSLTTTTFLTTAHDPCNDTLDCQLVDKFWGICGNITTATGCLSYCGFCPSGIPINQGSKTSVNSTLLPVSNTKFALSTYSSSSGTPILSSVTTSSQKVSISSPSITALINGISSGSTSSRSSGTPPGGLTGTTTPSCQDSPTVDCALIDKFWHVCSDIQTAQSCLRHCGFCP